MEGCFTFQWGGGGVFQMGGFIFKWGGDAPHGGASVLMGGVEKNRRRGVTPPLWETLGMHAIL